MIAGSIAAVLVVALCCGAAVVCTREVLGYLRMREERVRGDTHEKRIEALEGLVAALRHENREAAMARMRGR